MTWKMIFVVMQRNTEGTESFDIITINPNHLIVGLNKQIVNSASIPEQV